MTLRLAVLALLLSCAMPVKRTTAAGTGTQLPQPAPRIPGLYRMPINPVQPESGITTGLVVAYGHVLQPPYHVEARGAAVFVNGVQIVPGLEPPALVELRRRRQDSLAVRPAAIRARADSATAAIYTMEHVFDSVFPSVGRLSALEQAAQRVQGLSVVESVRVDTVRSCVTVKFTRDKYPTEVQLPAYHAARDPHGQAWRDSLNRAAVQHSAQLIAGMLAAGNAQVYHIDGASSSWAEMRRVHAVLADSSLTDDERFQRLASITSSAVWFLDNFEPSEWSIVGADDSEKRD